MENDALTIEEFEALVGGRVEAIEPLERDVKKEELEKIRDSLTAQRDNAWAIYNQAIGALALADELLSKWEAPVAN